MLAPQTAGDVVLLASLAVLVCCALAVVVMGFCDMCGVTLPGESSTHTPTRCERLCVHSVILAVIGALFCVVIYGIYVVGIQTPADRVVLGIVVFALFVVLSGWYGQCMVEAHQSVVDAEQSVVGADQTAV